MLAVLLLVCVALLGGPAAGTETRTEYFARLEAQRAIDANGNLARASDALRMLWRDLVFERDTIYLVDLFERDDALSPPQADELVKRLAGLGWSAAFCRFRCAQVACESYGFASNCRCRCMALAGNNSAIDMTRHTFHVHQGALVLGLSEYQGYQRGLWFETGVRPRRHDNRGWEADTYSCDHVTAADTGPRLLLRLDTRAPQAERFSFSV